MEKKKYRKVNFRIGHCSSEDPQYPVTELLYQSSDAKGWQSKRFATYPQIIILELAQPTLLRQISLLSHQSKISSRVEIQAKLDESKDYKKLGYVSLTSNENTNFQARQLRTANINGIPACFVKFTLRVNHVNSQNVFNQVGLISASIYGDPLAEGSFSSPSEQMGSSIPSTSSRDKGTVPSLDFDKQTLSKLKELQIKKKEAVDNQQFDLAKQIKDRIEMIKKIGQTLILLEQRKQEAVKIQDFQAAKIINEQMKKMREQNGWGPSLSNKPSGSNVQYYNQQRKAQQYQQQDQVKQSSISPNSKGYKKQAVQEHFQQSTKPQQQLVKQQPTQRTVGFKKIQAQEDRPLDVKGTTPPPQFAQEQVRGNGQLEPLSKQLFSQCEPFFDIFDEEFFRHIFSKDHKNRQNGLLSIKRKLGERIEDRQTFIQAVLFAIKNSIDDRIASVLIATLEVFGEFMRRIKPQLNSNNQVFADYILEKMADYLGHTNEKIRNISDSIYASLPVYPLTNKDVCYKNLSVVYKREKPPKIMTARLKMIAKIISEYQLGRDYENTISFAVKYVDDKNNEVRNGAISIILAISKELGYNAVKPFLKGCRPQIIKAIEDQIAEGEGDNQDYDQRPIKSVNKGATKSNKHSQFQSVENEFINVPKNSNNENSDYICEFCHKFDKGFAKQEYMDIHLFQACPMLTICLECKQSIEIHYLTAHQLSQCENSKYYKKCPRCKQAVLQKNFKVHVEKKQCLPAKPMAAANRCPLCHMDIAKGMQGWRQHLVEQGCQNNPRQ